MKTSKGEKLKVWFVELRAPFFTAAVVPTLLGTAIAWEELGLFDGWLFILTLLGTVFAHAGTNVINDYFDFKSGTDLANKDKTPFNGAWTQITIDLMAGNPVLDVELSDLDDDGYLDIIIASNDGNVYIYRNVA